MTWTDLDGNDGKIRRLSTELQKDASREMLFLTVWKWYWMEDDTKQWFGYQAEVIISIFSNLVIILC